MADDKIINIIESTLNKIVSEISSNLDSTGTTASGRTKKSLEVVMRDNGGQILGRSYFQGVEKGRPGGRVPYNFRDIIKQWIIDKGLSVRMIPYLTDRPHKYSVEERSLNIMAGYIAHTIRERGTRLYRDGGREDIYTNVIDSALDSLMRQVSIIITEDIRDK